MSNKLIGLLIPANGECKRIEIENTLKALQKVVGGYIETMTLSTDHVLIVNEEGKIHGLSPNKYLHGIVGDALLVRVSGDEFSSMADEEVEALQRCV